jgi:plasmid stabilization system protein ParE
MALPSKPMRYRVTKQAERDLDEIYLYWAMRASPETADRLIDGIIERFWLLGEYPDAGKPSEDIPGVKCFPAGKYLVYYRARRRVVDILHVFRGAPDQGASFGTGENRG